MSGKAIDYRILLQRDGQTQGQRLAADLPPGIMLIDGRTAADLLEWVKKLAGELKFFEADGSVNGSWQEFFELDAATVQRLVAQRALPPHFALLHTFLQLYAEPQRLLDKLTGKHLDFYYRSVLGQQETPAAPPAAHVVFQLKQNAVPQVLLSGTKLVVDKDAYYQLEEDLVVNAASVAALRSIYIDPAQPGTVRMATVANSADGLGAPLDTSKPVWDAFGHGSLPAAQTGFALASDVLRMKEGSRTITLVLEVGDYVAPAGTGGLAGLFSLSITGEKGWLGLGPVTPSVQAAAGGKAFVTFTANLTADDAAVVDYNATLHGMNYEAAAPLLLATIRNDGTYGYAQVKNWRLLAVTIDVRVQGVRDLQLENDGGTLDARKPFKPFGSMPEEGAGLYVGCPEALGKKLKSLSLHLAWKGIPEANLAHVYQHYKGYKITNNAFTVTAAFGDAGGWQPNERKNLFGNNATAPVTLTFSNPSFGLVLAPIFFQNLQIAPVKKVGYNLAKSLQLSVASLQPQLQPQFALQTGLVLSYFPLFSRLTSRKGLITLRLNQSFLFREYRAIYANAIIEASRNPKNAPALPQEPFAPEVQSLTLDYTATSGRIACTNASLEDYLATPVRLFHQGAFGQMRVHAYAGLQGGAGTSVHLLPQYNHTGEFCIGLTGIGAEESTGILFQVAEGSANPDRGKALLEWWVLCDNQWKLLEDRQLLSDTTNGLLTSGIVRIAIPKEATTENTLLPGGMLWLRATLRSPIDSVCRMVGVQANAARVVYAGNPAQAKPLPAAAITKLANPVGAIKTILQPYASFGGRATEQPAAFYTRVSERLRHKQRAVTLWDYERLVLAQFPQVHKVKCIPHSDGRSFYEAGHVLTVVVPNLTNQYAVDPLRPRVDKYSIEGIQTFLQQHAGSWVTHHVENPVYQPVQIAATLAFRQGFAPGYYKGAIDKALQGFLSPWLGGGDIHFGGKVTKSMIVQFLEAQPAVDYIADLKLFQSLNGGDSFGADRDVVAPTHPAAILVSHSQHQINTHP